MTDEEIILQELQNRFHLHELEVPENRFNIPPKVVCTALLEDPSGEYKVAFTHDSYWTTFAFPDIVDLVEFFQEVNFQAIRDVSLEWNALFQEAISKKKNLQ